MKSLCLLSSATALSLFAAVAGCDGVQSGKFDSAGVEIHYRFAGDGLPVILIHGLYSSAGINWHLPGTIKLLAENYRVIALDARGHGRSGKPKEDDAYGVAMVEDVIRLMDHLEIEKAHIVGYSMGGMIAMKLITEHPDRVLTGSLGGMGWLREGSGLQKFWDNVPARERGPVPSACLRHLADLAVTEEAVRAVDVPMAVFVGDRDICKTLYVEPLSRIRDWPVVEIKDAGHFNCIFKDEFKQEVKKWLDGNESAGAASQDSVAESR
jgi:pimeloyl-ACP methyl ester carboxylesterase